MKNEPPEKTNPHVFDHYEQLDILEIRVQSLEDFRDRIQNIEKEFLITMKVVGQIFKIVGKFLKWNFFLGVAYGIAYFTNIFDLFKL